MSDNPSLPFDFDSHRKQAVEHYQKLRPYYEEFADVIEAILQEALASRNIKIASTEARAKSIKSFGDKAAQSSATDPAQPKYKDPLTDITDLAGVRIITFFPKTAEGVDELINAEFTVREKLDKADSLKQEDRFGYQSTHYLVSLKQNRTALPEYGKFRDFIAEIQVRTILQHAWAEIEHDIQYKSVTTIPTSIRRRFLALAGLFEIADREFQAIQDEDEILRQAARVSMREGKFEIVEITPDALKDYLDRKLGADGRMRPYSYDWTARFLHRMGFSNFQQIDECVSKYNDDRLSRIIWGNRAGQLARFELQLLAGMGEHFAFSHPFGDSEWFIRSSRERIEKLKMSGIEIGNYRPPKKQELDSNAI